MPLIENVSWGDVQNGHHTDMGSNAIMIQIVDPLTEFPVPKREFKEIHQFEFLDAEDSDAERLGEEFLISDYQANKLVCILQDALTDGMNVLVHCHMGCCRSGSVTEVGEIMGFTPTNRFRQPNLRVKHKMLRVLGLTYDSNEKPQCKGGEISAGGIMIPFVGYTE